MANNANSSILSASTSTSFITSTSHPNPLYFILLPSSLSPLPHFLSLVCPLGQLKVHQLARSIINSTSTWLPMTMARIGLTARGNHNDDAVDQETDGQLAKWLFVVDFYVFRARGDKELNWFCPRGDNFPLFLSVGHSV